MAGRTRYNAMAPVPQTTWPVVQDQYQVPISVTELPPDTDPRMVMIGAMSKSIGKGWDVEELPGVIPVYFCRKGNDRRMVSIMRKHPSDPSVAKRS
jgi:hypothetical protein